MHIPIRKAERALEWNLNTIMNAVTLAGVLVTGGVLWNDTRRDIVSVNEWIADHEGEVRERRGSIDAGISRVSAQVTGLDDRLDSQEALTVRLSDRISAAEARSAEFAVALRELQTAINQQSGDLKVILSWVDEQRRQGGK